jgi:hypothetical protein
MTRAQQSGEAACSANGELNIVWLCDASVLRAIAVASHLGFRLCHRIDLHTTMADLAGRRNVRNCDLTVRTAQLPVNMVDALCSMITAPAGAVEGSLRATGIVAVLQNVWWCAARGTIKSSSK